MTDDAEPTAGVAPPSPAPSPPAARGGNDPAWPGNSDSEDEDADADEDGDEDCDSDGSYYMDAEGNDIYIGWMTTFREC